jgi:hypothetical protein
MALTQDIVFRHIHKAVNKYCEHHHFNSIVLKQINCIHIYNQDDLHLTVLYTMNQDTVRIIIRAIVMPYINNINRTIVDSIVADSQQHLIATDYSFVYENNNLCLAHVIDIKRMSNISAKIMLSLSEVALHNSEMRVVLENIVTQHYVMKHN